MAEITPEKAFENLKQNVVDSISSYFPYEGKKQKVVLNKIWVEDSLRTDDIKDQTKAKDSEKTWGVPVKADVALVDKVTGKVIDKRTMTMARLPKLTNRYGYIVDGNELQVDHLFRLKSGVYARVQDNGDLESEFNLAQSPTGRGFSVKLDRASKKFSLKYGESHIDLYPILKATGVSDDELEKAWGKQIFEANKITNPKKFDAALHKFWSRTAEEGEATPKDTGDYAKYVHGFFEETRLNPDTTKITLGKSFDRANGQALHLAASKILGVSRGTHKQDDRDSLAFKEIVSAEDFIPEKIQKNARTIKARLRQTVDHKKSVIEVLQPDLFNRPIHEFFTKGGSIAERSDQTNPILMLSGHRKTTLFSDQFGGIKNDNSLTNEMRVINPSHFGFLDPMHTPESERTGITLNLSMAARKNGKDLETPAFNVKTGKLEYVKAPQFHHEVAAVLPDQVRWVKGKPQPIADKVKMKLPGGDIELRPWKEATHIMPTAKGMFDVASNLIPFLPANQGNRVSMADKQMEQAISLKHREAPLVQSKTDHPDPNHTFEKLVGSFSSHKAPIAGTVMSVKDDSIVIKGQDGKKHEVQLYAHFPLNDPKGMMHSTPSVKVGDAVKAGQHIADTNYTKDGQLALGANLRVGYIPYKGYNFEDGIVISESAAKKLTSEHLYKKKLELDPDSGDVVHKAKYQAHASQKATSTPKHHWEALDDDGIIKPGTKVEPGQVMIAALGKNIGSKQGSVLSAYGKKAFEPFKSKALVWDEDHVGTVVKVIKDPAGKNHKVYVKTEESMVVGDKLSGRHGNKGIVTMILPDHEMPHTVDKETGEKRHLEVLLNPSGVPTRMNVGQILETAAGKIAEKTGKPFVVNNFAGPGHDYRKHVEEELKKHGISDEELVYDPNDSRKALGSVLVGPQYLLKLRHQVEKKLAVRGGGTSLSGKPLAYDLDNQPAKGDHPGQGFGALEVYTLLGHNARHNLREMATYKSDHQDISFWNMIQAGQEPPTPKAPFAYEKFVTLLKGAGINVTKNGSAVQLSPLTDKHVLDLAGGHKGEIKHGHLTVRSKDLREEKGGLFDPTVTGGLNGDKWSFIRLAEPMPNPMFVGQNNRPGPVPVLLGLKGPEIEDIMAGRKKLDGKTGGHAIHDALRKVNVEKELSQIKEKLPHLTGSDLDRANKKAKFLMALQEQGLKPHEAYMMNYVPVVPPKFRPAVPTQRGDVNYAPLNGLYKNIAVTNQKLHEFDPEIFTENHKHPLRNQLWDSLKALQSVGKYKDPYDPDSRGNRKLKGILDTIGSGEGEQPKEAFFQSKLVKRRQNLSIRSTIVPEPKLGIDEVGVPKNAAMELYKPFVVAQLGKWGVTPLEAQSKMRQGDQLAFKALEHVVADRPLLLKRDPALHKFSLMAFKPVLVEGKAIQIHPLVTGGFNADFDGDTMAGSVPISRAAVEEAKRLFPSKNLYSPTTGKVMYVPGQEAVLGLHLLTKWGNKTGKTFATVADLEKAVDRGDVGINDAVKVSQIGSKETTLGRIRIESRLPRSYKGREEILHDAAYDLNKKTLGNLASSLAKNHQEEFAKSIDHLKDLGNDHSYRAGFSFGLKDFAPLKARDEIIRKANAEADKVRKTVKDPMQQEAKLVEVYQKATDQIDKAAKESLKGNRLATMIYSGARGKPEQLRQMIAAPMLMQDGTNRTLPTPVTKSYAEGLDIGDYWLAQHGARKGTLQRALGTSEPGVISKDIINTTMDTLISSPDCGTKHGILMDVKSSDVYDRYLATDYKLKNGVHLKAGTLVTPEVTSRLQNHKVDKVLVRSPLKCQHGDGVCSKCFGLNENGTLHDVGTNVGVLAGQALGEPAVQMAMDAFHAGGIAAGRGAVSVDRFTRLRQLLEMPQKLKNEATLARATGKISTVKKDATGGLEVFIGNERHYVPKNLVKEDLKVGTEVKKGDPLSHGPINPHHLLAHTDMHTVQNYLTNELHNGLYEKEGVRRRNVETVVRALTNITQIKDPGHSTYLHGDIVPHSIVEEYNRSMPSGSKAVKHTPILKSITQVKNTSSTDWMARLNYRELHRTLQEGAQMGWKSDLHGSHPIPGYAYGAEFGKPPAGKKPHQY